MRSQVSASASSPLRRISSTISRALAVAASPCCCAEQCGHHRSDAGHGSSRSNLPVGHSCWTVISPRGGIRYLRVHVSPPCHTLSTLPFRENHDCPPPHDQTARLQRLHELRKPSRSSSWITIVTHGFAAAGDTAPHTRATRSASCDIFIERCPPAAADVPQRERFSMRGAAGQAWMLGCLKPNAD